MSDQQPILERAGFRPKYRHVTVKELQVYLGSSYMTAMRRMNEMRDVLDKRRVFTGKNGKPKKLNKLITWPEAWEYLG